MNFTSNNNGQAFRSPEGYVIRRDGTDIQPAYWKAFDPSGKEIAAGAGDQGWLKCVHYAERHQELNQHVSQQIADTRASIAQPAAARSSTANSPAKSCDSSATDASPQQGALL